MRTTSMGSLPISPTTPSSRGHGDRICWGQRFVGKSDVRDAFAARFSGIPDIRYQDDEHFVDGDRGASEWTLSGTSTTGQRIEVRGCDLWTFRDGKVVKKDSYWKIRTTD